MYTIHKAYVPIILNVVSTLKDFSRSQAVTYAVNDNISEKLRDRVTVAT